MVERDHPVVSSQAGDLLAPYSDRAAETMCQHNGITVALRPVCGHRAGRPRRLGENAGRRLGRRHISLAGLTVPTLVIGSERDRLTPISQSRRSARTAPHLVGLVELPGGHCPMLERLQEVNRELRSLVESAAAARRISS